jgi:EAL and modified HD-GYP domain-containing signal transduction protein
MMLPLDADIFLARQPILDREQKLVAYELLFRSSGVDRAAVADGRLATARVVANAFGEMSLGDVLGPYKAYINATPDFVLGPEVEILPGASVVLELPADTPADETLLARCRELKQQGFTFALGGVAEFAEINLPLLPEAEILKVDHQLLDNHQLFLLACKLRPLQKKLLAEKIENRSQMEHCFDLGFEYFQGYYFARPTLISGKKLTHSAMTVMRLLDLILKDADTAALERSFKGEPGLTLNLLRLTNSCASGLAVRIASVRHAITILGRNQLQRWLQLLLYADPEGGEVGPLLQLAATRGRFLELVTQKFLPRQKDLPDRAFMVGILSLLPAVIGQPIADIITPLPLPPDVKQALIEYKGDLGRLLALAEQLEKADGDATFNGLIAEMPGLRGTLLTECLAQAMAWANMLARDS